ncbi:MAG TPA: YdiU family protein [Gammaproteobacteria bacterium]|nr:YdiU family protein [Gammaproteobacteria bacterium]
MKSLHDLQFDNRFARLPEAFYARVQPRPLPEPHLVAVSEPACALLDLDPASLERPEAVRCLVGEQPLPGAEPLAALYAGHQFGRFVPQLGDGRAILLGEVRNAAGEHWEIQLKGAGITPWSRDGDGRAVLRSSIREFLCSEAMAGLGIPTTRALALLGGDEEVYRERIEPGAILVRLAPSFVRFGSFEVFYYRDQYRRLEELLAHVIEHDYPELAEAPNPALALLHEVVRRTARLVAQWQLVGFAHGVLNTDNMSILGLTLDYGPFGFLDAYDPGFVCNHSDWQGRYAFDRQPSIGLWNLSCLAQAMLPLLDPEDGEAAAELARDALAQYEPALVETWAAGLRAKLGLREARDEDQSLATRLLDCMAAQRADYTLTFRRLADLRLDGDPADDAPLRALFADPAALDPWLANYRARLRAEGSDDAERRARMCAVNPRYILRNYLAQQAIERAEAGDFSEVKRLLKVLERPFDEQPEHAELADLPPAWAAEIAVSCSS